MLASSCVCVCVYICQASQLSLADYVVSCGAQWASATSRSCDWDEPIWTVDVAREDGGELWKCERWLRSEVVQWTPKCGIQLVLWATRRAMTWEWMKAMAWRLRTRWARQGRPFEVTVRMRVERETSAFVI